MFLSVREDVFRCDGCRRIHFANSLSFFLVYLFFLIYMYVSDGISRWRTKNVFLLQPLLLSTSSNIALLSLFSFLFHLLFNYFFLLIQYSLVMFLFPFFIFYFTFALYWVWEECYAWELSNDHISIIELYLAYSVQCSKKIMRIGSRKLYITCYYSVQPLNLHIKRNFNHLICLAFD